MMNGEGGVCNENDFRLTKKMMRGRALFYRLLKREDLNFFKFSYENLLLDSSIICIIKSRREISRQYRKRIKDMSKSILNLCLEKSI